MRQRDGMSVGDRARRYWGRGALVGSSYQD